MKLYKIFALALAAITLTACSDDDKTSYNTAPGVSVSMKEATLSLDELSGVSQIPVVVNGEANGLIEVTVKVTECGPEPAMDDVHYFITSKTVKIPASTTEGYIEILPVNDDDMNDNRTFTIELVSAKGASLAAPVATEVTILDEDGVVPRVYAALTGQYTLDWDGGSTTVELYAYEEGDEDYLQYVEIDADLNDGAPFQYLFLEFSYSLAEDVVTLTAPHGYYCSSALGLSVGTGRIVIGALNGNPIALDGSSAFVSNEEHTIFNCTDSTVFFFYTGSWYLWDQWSNARLTYLGPLAEM